MALTSPHACAGSSPIAFQGGNGLGRSAASSTFADAAGRLRLGGIWVRPVQAMRVKNIAAVVVGALAMWSSQRCAAEPAQTPAATPGLTDALAQSRARCAGFGDPAPIIKGCTDEIQSEQPTSVYLPQALMLRGLAYRRQKQFKLAINDLTRSIDLGRSLDINPGDLLIEYLNRGNTYEFEGFFQEALSDYNSAIALRSDHFGGYEGRGRVHEQLGLHSLAVVDFSQAIKAQPAYGALYQERADSYQAEGSQDQAIADYTKAIAILEPEVGQSSSLRSNLARAYNARAWSYLLRKEDALALPDVEQALALFPQWFEAVETRAEVNERLGRRGDAIADYQAALRLHPDLKAAQDGLRRLGAQP
jgi:tetratricopeptide (TPR) repeat protein